MRALCDWLVGHGSSCLEFVGFLTGVLNVWLVTRQSIWNWPVGIINASVFLVVFATSGLYSDTGLQVVYLLLSVYGWWYWRFGAPTTNHTPITRTARNTTFVLCGVGIVSWIALAIVTHRIPGARLPWFDAALVAASLVAQWMMTRKLLEHWVVWIVADILYVVLFAVRGLPLTAVLYSLYTLLALRGLQQWRRAYAAQ